MHSPLISVIIPYYRRGAIFDNCLESVVHQDYARREVIVIDNHSQDDLKERIAGRHANVTLVALPSNLGACAARNHGILAAHGEILVFLDDDVSFVSPFALTRIVGAFDRRPEFAVLALRVCDPHSGKLRVREWCHTRPCKEFAEQEFETNWFGEGACAVRREVFEECGRYYEPLFYGGEGHDLIVRVLDHGFRILYVPGISVDHWASDTPRTLARQYYYFTRNYVWMAYKDYRVLDGLMFLAPKLLMMLYFSWRSSVYGPFFRGLWDGGKGLRRVHADRTPISRDTVRYLSELEKWRPGWMARLARHRAEPQI